MAKEIKQKIVLEGEKEYSAALKEANRNLKTLRSELKAETAELGRNATEQQKAEAKAKSLQKQIAEQEKVVKTYEKALEEVRQKYGDNEDAIASWEQKLNNARTSLANMKNDLEGVGESFQGINTDAAAATVATKSVADALGQIGSAGSTVSGAIEDIFTGMISTVADALSEIWALINETAAKANRWTDIAGYWNTNTQTIQQWARATEASGNSFDDLVNGVTKLAMGDKDKIKALTGVSWAGDMDEWQYSMDVLNSIASMGHQQRNEALKALFGDRRSTRIMDILNDWGNIQQLLPQFNGNETGYGMGDQELQDMTRLWVQINTIEEKWDALKDKVAAGLGVASMELLVNVEGVLDGIADFMKAEDEGEKQAALEKIRTNMEAFFRKLGEIVNDCIGILNEVGQDLQKSDDPVTKAIGDILVGLTDALSWMVEHQNEVKTAFETIFGIWLLGKLAAVAGSLGSIVMQIEAIKAFKGLGAAESAAAAASAGSAQGGAWASAFWAAAKVAAPALAFLYALFENALTEQGNDDLWDSEGNPTALGAELGIGQTKEEAQAEWLQSEEGQNSIWGGKGDRIEEAGIINRNQYARLNTLWRAYSGLETNSMSQEELLERARREFEGQEELLDSYLQKIYELRNSGSRPEDLPLDWFGVYPEVEEYEDLTPTYDAADREQAVQDWWDAWRNAANGDDTWDEEGSAFAWMQEVFGDDFGNVWDGIIAKLDEMGEKQLKMEDIPQSWWLNGDQWSNTGSQQEGITSGDLANFNSLPGQIQKAAKEGTAAGVSGIKVTMDGATVGRLVAPYVSQIIARDIS